MTQINDFMFVVRSNQKHDLYLGFTHTKNSYSSKIENVAQNDLDFAFYFDTKEDAERFKDEYFNNVFVKDYNKKYYKVICVKTENIDSNIFMYNIPCYFSKTNWLNWLADPEKYKKNIS